MSLRRSAFALIAVAVFAVTSVRLPAQMAGAAQVNPGLFAEMKWRNIGPLRGGRTKAAAGVPSQPFTFYFGMVNGGVWKTINAGRTWTPIFDDQPTGSIGAIAVAPSDPNIIYVGSGEGLQRPDLAIGDGMYKSTDAGETWTHLGLRDSQQIPMVVVDPKNPNRLFVAVLGHPYGPNEERGIFRSLDGGATFQKVLYEGPDVGGKDVDIDPSNPNIIFATLWEARQGPWENGAWAGLGGGVFKSTDGGATWKKLTNAGFPANLATAELTIAPTNAKRMYARIATGAAPGAAGVAQGGRGGGRAGGAPAGPQFAPFYRSDDGGETWAPTTNDMRVGTSDEAAILVDPKDPDVIIVTSQVTTRSTDGGKTWVPFKGAPGGDDYQAGFINPTNTDIIFLVADQGAVVSLDHGVSWSSWYNQPTAAMFHINTDNDFPYRVCGGQQDSGSACVQSRGNDGAITFREWHPAAVEEYGYAAPDPLDPNLVYGGKVTRYDRRTGQVSNVGPLAGRGGGPAPAPGAPEVGRTVRTLPVVFSLADPRALFYGTNVLWKTVNGGITWKQISPDLTRKTHDVPKNIGKYSEIAKTQVDTNSARVIYTIGPSYKDINTIWAGTDDGVIQVTRDGGLHWSDVTPKEMVSYQKVFMVEPGRFDANTAYAAINTLRMDDQNPHLYRTHDGGKTWKEIVNGIPGGNALSAVREDVKQKGLLYAGTETQVYVSFDDGDHWQSLRQNMAPSSVRDLIVKDDDLVAGTHGRGIWILDDLTPLRQIAANRASVGATDMLFKPQAALRVRWNTNTDTPLPLDEPRMANPPEGAIINYYLANDASGPVTLEVFQGSRLVRRYSSTDVVPQLPDPLTNAPLTLFWYRAPQYLSTKAGMHRFMWDVHYQPLAPVPGGAAGGGRAGGGGRGGGANPGIIGALPISAVPYNTVPSPTTPWVAPGEYTVKLTANGKTHVQTMTVKQDPRVKTPALTMQQVYATSTAAYYEAVAAGDAARSAQGLRDQIAKLSATGDTQKALAAFDKQLADLNLGAAASGLSGVMNLLQGADVAPTDVQMKAIGTARATAASAMLKWNAIKTRGLAAINTQLKAAGLGPLSL